MSHGYTPSATYHGGAITVPDDGDDRKASTWVPPIEAALDNAAYLQSKILPFLPNGGSFPYFIADISSGNTVSNSGSPTFAGAVIGTIANSATYVDMLSNVTVTSDARAGDIALTIIMGMVIVVMGGANGEAQMKIRSKQGSASEADVAPVPGWDGYYPLASDSSRAQSFSMMAWDQITTAGSYETFVAGRVVGGGLTSIQLWGVVNAYTFILRPAPNP